MAIEWNKVTWYSKLSAVVLAVLILYLGFYLGSRWQKQQREISQNEEATKVQTPEKTNPISITIKTIKEENWSGSMPVISGTSTLASSARAYIDKTIVEFRTQANIDVPKIREQFGADNPSSNYTMDIDAKYSVSEKTESIVMSVNVYTGGAHGNSYYKVFTANRSSGKIMTLSDIIKENKQTAFTEFVKKQLISWRPEGSQASMVFEEDIKSLVFISFSNWSMDSKNLYIYFDQYAIGPGALGAVAFPLSQEKIKEYE